MGRMDPNAVSRVGGARAHMAWAVSATARPRLKQAYPCPGPDTRPAMPEQSHVCARSPPCALPRRAGRSRHRKRTAGDFPSARYTNAGLCVDKHPEWPEVVGKLAPELLKGERTVPMSPDREARSLARGTRAKAISNARRRRRGSLYYRASPPFLPSSAALTGLEQVPDLGEGSGCSPRLLPVAKHGFEVFYGRFWVRWRRGK